MYFLPLFWASFSPSGPLQNRGSLLEEGSVGGKIPGSAGRPWLHNLLRPGHSLRQKSVSGVGPVKMETCLLGLQGW